MTANDNTVNIKNRTGRYHHGDLRSALIEEGMAELASKAPEDVSLREIARRAGVSATAVYRHFPDKAALLSALCEEGSRKLAAAFRTAMEGQASRKEAFNAMGRAYVRFALANPSLFRMFTTLHGPDMSKGDAERTPDDAFAMLSGMLTELMPPGATTADRDIKRLQAWALVHGLAMLMLDGQVPADEALIDKVISSTFL